MKLTTGKYTEGQNRGLFTSEFLIVIICIVLSCIHIDLFKLIGIVSICIAYVISRGLSKKTTVTNIEATKNAEIQKVQDIHVHYPTKTIEQEEQKSKEDVVNETTIVEESKVKHYIIDKTR